VFRVTAPGARVVVGLPDPERPGAAEPRRRLVERVAGASREILLETDRVIVGVR
jgi:hypothetical protein